MTPNIPNLSSLPLAKPVQLLAGLKAILNEGAPDAGAKLDALFAAEPFNVAQLDRDGHSLLHLALSVMPDVPLTGIDATKVYPTVGWLLDHGAPADAVSVHGRSVMAEALYKTRYPVTHAAIKVAMEKAILEKTLCAATLDERPRPRL